MMWTIFFLLEFVRTKVDGTCGRQNGKIVNLTSVHKDNSEAQLHPHKVFKILGYTTRPCIQKKSPWPLFLYLS
jgi:hypothetical protein